jgi:hypothetical protein
VRISVSCYLSFKCRLGSLFDEIGVSNLAPARRGARSSDLSDLYDAATAQIRRRGCSVNTTDALLGLTGPPSSCGCGGRLGPARAR